MTNLRIGSGYDIHALVPGRALVLGGIAVESDVGLEGHSDGDVVLHALCDALLGATARGDLGQYFPPGDPATRGIASEKIVEKILQVVAIDGVSLVNVDVTVIAQRPRLSPYFERMRDNVARILQLPRSRVSIKAKTSDHLGAVGRGEGVAAQAVVLLETAASG